MEHLRGYDAWLTNEYEYPDGESWCHACRPDLEGDGRDNPCEHHLRQLRDDIREMDWSDDDGGDCPF